MRGPQIVQLTVTNRCQCRCSHCGVTYLRARFRTELDLDAIAAILDQLAMIGCQVLDLFGGEPTLRRDLCDIVRLARERQLFVSLESNGERLDRELLAQLKAAGLRLVYISLDDDRPEVHDERRRRPGLFSRALAAIDAAHELGIEVHVSTVPATSETITRGHINRLLALCKTHGVAKIRVILPRYVGGSRQARVDSFAGGDTSQLFSYIEERFWQDVYLHAPSAPLGSIDTCSAKTVFCHIMSNGFFAPCPYYPLIFGDVTREPVLDLFERVQSHPFIRRGGRLCPMRDPELIDDVLPELGPSQPYREITVGNLVDSRSRCPYRCRGCAYGTATRAGRRDHLRRRLAAVDTGYERLELFGGDLLTRRDAVSLLRDVGRPLDLWTTAMPLARDGELAAGVRDAGVRALKVLWPALESAAFDARTGVAGSHAAALAGLRAALAAGLETHGFVPLAALSRGAAPFAELPLSRLYTFEALEPNDTHPALPNAAACFGRRLSRYSLVSLRARAP